MSLTNLFLFAIFPFFLYRSSSSSVTISIAPQILSKSGDSVRINWTGIDSPSDLDWLGIYSPSDSPHKNYIGYIFLSSSPTWKSGFGSVQIPLVNIRSDYQFRIFRWTSIEIDREHHDHDHNPLPGTDHLLAKSGPLRFETGHGPEQIHLAYTDNESEMRVMFISGDGSKNFVKYGLDSDQLSKIVPTAVSTYSRDDMCHSPANDSVGWRDPGYIHDGVMTNLNPGKRYYYKVGNQSLGWSATHSFISRNLDSDQTIAFLFGDMGTSTPYATFIRTQEESKSTIKWILRDLKNLGENPAFISHIGDISYARGYSWIWDAFFTQIEPVASQVPYHVCIGNHEYDWPQQPWRPDWAATIYGTDGGGECGVPYSLKFNMPGNFSEPTGTCAPATRNLFYSFNAGSVHFVYVSTETNFLMGSAQYERLKRDLELVDREKTPFVVVQGHRPMYTTSHESRDAPMRDKMVHHLEPLLVKNNVTLALWGHVHRYERFCPLKNYTCANAGEVYSERLPVHLVIGMGGQDWQPIWQPRIDHPDDPIFPQPKRSMYRGGEFGYTRIFANKEKLTLSYVGNHDGKVHDRVEILASGRVLNGVSDPFLLPDESKVPKFARYVKSGLLLVLVVCLAYVLGFVSHGRKACISKKSWIPVQSEET